MKKQAYQLPLDLEIEVFAFKGDIKKKVSMTYGEWLNLKKKKGWWYSAYKKGYNTTKL